MNLRRSLQTQTRGGQTCSEYFAQMVNLSDQLADTGSPIPDSDLITYILNGLGADYNSFIVALTTKSDPVTLSDLHGFLLSHENLLLTQHSTAYTDPIALYSAQSHRGCSRGRGSDRGHRG